MKCFFKTVAAAILVAGALTAATQAGTEAEDLRAAEHAILAHLTIGSSPQGASRCTETPILCLEGDPAELGMAVIASRRSPASLRALARLYRYRLDGDYSETLDQYMCEAGHPVEKYLASIDPQQLHEQCVGEFTRFVAFASRSANLEGAKIERVCREASTIRSEVKSALLMVRHPPKSCEP